MKKVGWNQVKKYGAMLLVGLMAAPVGISSLAAETIGDGATSEVNAILGAPDIVPPTPPIIPPGPGEEDGGTGNDGPLRVDFVTPLNFGERQLTGGREIFSAENTHPNVQVSDFRATGTGWSLHVSTNGFEDEATDTALRGAELIFVEGSLETDTNGVPDPLTHTATIYANSGSVPVMTAPAGHGMGTWAHRFADVTLEIPAGNLAGDYEATLFWTLVNAPS